MDINKIIKSLEAKNIELNLSIETYQKTKERIREEKDNLLKLEKLKTLIIEIGQKSQNSIIEYIESTVTMGLASVFGDEYKFKIEMTNKRDQSEVNFFIEHQGNLLEPKLDLLGGGIIDTCAFLLRLVVWSLTNSNGVNLFFFDEPFKMVSKEYIPKVSEMVKEMSSMLNIQIIMVSHNENLIENADNIIMI